MSYFKSIRQDVVPDTANTYSGTIENAATWNSDGTGTSTLGVNAIQIVVKSDKDLTIYVDQGNTDSSFQVIDTYHYHTTKNFGITVQAVSAYVRVRATNSSGTTATVTIDTVLCPIVEALPRSLDEDGHLQTAIAGISDEYGFDVENTPMGEMRIVQPTRLVGATFEGSALDPIFWNSSVANSATVTALNAEVVLDTKTTAANGAAYLSSMRRARYVSSSSMRYRAVVQLSAGATNNKRRWGIGYGATMPATITVTDGAWYQYDGTTFGIAYQRGNAAPTVVTSFNGNLGASYAPTADAVNTYEIYWTNSKIYFSVAGEVHHTVNANTATWSTTMSFYIFADNVNSSGAQTSNTLACRVASISRLGGLLTQPTSYYLASGQTAGTNLKLGAGNLHSLIINNVVNNSVITLSDSTTTSTPVIIAHTAGATATGVSSIDLKGIPFFNGLRLTVTTQNASVTVIYE